jgi:hypothetical protein
VASAINQVFQEFMGSSPLWAPGWGVNPVIFRIYGGYTCFEAGFFVKVVQYGAIGCKKSYGEAVDLLDSEFSDYWIRTGVMTSSMILAASS